MDHELGDLLVGVSSKETEVGGQAFDGPVNEG
jgi:hypothetical protein